MQNISAEFIWSAAEWTAAGLGLLGVVLGFRQHRGTWLAWLLSSALYLLLTWHWGLLGQSLVMLAFIGVCGWGYWQWNRSRAEAIVVLTAPVLWASLAGAGLLTLLLEHGLARLGGSFAPLDAAIAGLSLLAMVWTGRRHRACWLIWLLVNLLSVVLYAAQGLWPTTILYIVQAGLSLVGLARWRAMATAAQAR